MRRRFVGYDGELLFGRFTGFHVSDPAVETQYIRWILREVELSDQERGQIQAELLRRSRQNRTGGRGYQESVLLPAGVTKDSLLQVVAAGRQAMARRLHPDVPGGSLERMQTVNAAADFLEGQIARFCQFSP